MDANLVTESGNGSGEPRYGLHDLVRRFVRERASVEDPAEVHDDALRRLLEHYGDAACRASSQVLADGRTAHLAGLDFKPTHRLRFDSDIDAMNWFDAEKSTIRATVADAAHRGWHDYVWRFACALRTLYRRSGEFDDYLAVHQLALAAARSLGDPIVEARVREGLGSVRMELGQPAQARDEWTTALARYVEAGEDMGIGRVNDSLGTAYGAMDELELAIAHHRAALAIPAYAAHPQYSALAELNLGVKYGKLGRLTEAEQAFTRALAVSRRFADSEVICLAEHNLAEVFIRNGDYARAEVHARAEIDVARDVGYPIREARGWEALATCLVERDRQQARAAWQRALELYEDLGHPFAQRVREQLTSG